MTRAGCRSEQNKGRPDKSNLEVRGESCLRHRSRRQPGTTSLEHLFHVAKRYNKCVNNETTYRRNGQTYICWPLFLSLLRQKSLSCEHVMKWAQERVQRWMLGLKVTGRVCARTLDVPYDADAGSVVWFTRIFITEYLNREGNVLRRSGTKKTGFEVPLSTC